ncbi:MAG TPA: bifunctional methionine sulfoxide reductase B/A protein [Desulfobacteraceae bacterium]|nr:bifunctional methionine sulfoxide reductase B/A protein [Desulfobacteraceae bacterium]HPJ68547.1 bifunctional methionine sulfoxide reductase B/A protein [Desulfobacteraceae bacterium]HPQ28695.1 bifunctional methionine sulfoxide reductase B/A protein [Desulfobacteraceae bacterium]
MDGNDSGASSRIPIFNAETGRVEKVERIVKSNAEWKKILTSEQYRIMREKGTEAPFTGKCETGEPGGIYKCVACGTDLFRVDEKFESGTGWPGFWKPVSELNIREEHDDSHGMERTEVLCARCGGHLGHVFNDGPAPSYRRYCINAAALTFFPAQKNGLGLEKAVFAAGCFWGVEETFRQTKGVISTQAGYTGGHTKDPDYEAVCTDRTGHAEAVLVEYDPSVISYEELLTIFWTMHNPTTPDRQGPDIGSQYRSAIFYFDKSQRRSAIASLEKIQASGKYKDRIVTEIVPVTAFYPAEDYHQKYYMKSKAPSCTR